MQNKPTGYISPDGPGLTVRALLGPLISDAPIGLALVDNEFRFVFVNGTLAAFNGRPAESHVAALAEEMLSSEIWEQMRPHFEQALNGDSPKNQPASGMSARGGMRHYLISYYPIKFDSRTIVGIALVVIDITESKQSEALVAGQNHILEGILQGAPLLGSLTAIVNLVESQLPGFLCSILLMDNDAERLRLGAAPSLPASYVRTIVERGLGIGEDAGPCASAVSQGKTVISEDIQKEYGNNELCTTLVYEAGVRGCRATPILGERNEILGTLCLFYTDDRSSPDPRESDLIEAVVYQARIAIERNREEVRRRNLLRDMLLSLTEGRLRLCWSTAELPEPLSERRSEPVALTSEELRSFRWSVTEVTKDMGMPIERRFDLETAVGEASMNAVVHAGGGEGAVYADSRTGTVQVWVRDHGKGIAEESLHRATLERGFTTAGSLGHGFWMILKTVDRIYLLTGEGGTTVVLEQDRDFYEPDWLTGEGLLPPAREPNVGNAV